MTDETQVNDDAKQQEKIHINPIVNVDANGVEYRYFEVESGEFEGVIFTLTEIGFVKTSTLPNAPDNLPDDDMTATARVLYEDTKDFTTKELNNNATFSDVIRTVLESIVEAIREAQLKHEEENPQTEDQVSTEIEVTDYGLDKEGEG